MRAEGGKMRGTYCSLLPPEARAHQIRPTLELYKNWQMLMYWVEGHWMRQTSFLFLRLGGSPFLLLLLLLRLEDSLFPLRACC